MDVKDAVQTAKRHIADLISDERPENIGLEEVEYDGQSGVWRVTIGFSRPWNREVAVTPNSSFTEILGIPKKAQRDLKVVVIDDAGGRVLSLKNRE
jgi:hypothetical protein